MEINSSLLYVIVSVLTLLVITGIAWGRLTNQISVVREEKSEFVTSKLLNAKMETINNSIQALDTRMNDSFLSLGRELSDLKKDVRSLRGNLE